LERAQERSTQPPVKLSFFLGFVFDPSSCHRSQVADPDLILLVEISFS
jgi:hypothetical protein